MELKNLGKMVWECRSMKGDNNGENNTIEISGNIEEYQNENDITYDRNVPGIDDEIVDVLDEIYCIKGLEKIYSAEHEEMDVKIENLKELSEQYTALLKFKQFYYKEVQESINRINNYNCEKNESDSSDIKCWNLILASERYLNRVEWPDKKYWYYSWDFKDYFYALPYFLLQFNISSKLFEEIIEKGHKIITNNFEKQIYSQHKNDIKLWMSFVKLFRNYVFGVEGEIIWLVFLCKLTQYICNENIEVKDLDHRISESLNQLIECTTDLIEKTTKQKIKDKQKDLLMCYRTQDISKEQFDIRVKHLLNALKADKDLNNKYLKRNGCIAIMNYDSRKYVALSGDDSTNSQKNLAKKVEELLPSDYNIVTNTENIRFYCGGEQYITYGQYKEWIRDNSDEVESLNGCVKRMFSCCERKLLAEIDHKCGDNKMEIYVKYKPCVFCDDALKAVAKSPKYSVIYIKKQKGNMKRKDRDYLIVLGRIIANKHTPT